jgi:hypothetical protein
LAHQFLGGIVESKRRLGGLPVSLVDSTLSGSRPAGRDPFFRPLAGHRLGQPVGRKLARVNSSKQAAKPIVDGVRKGGSAHSQRTRKNAKFRAN